MGEVASVPQQQDQLAAVKEELLQEGWAQLLPAFQYLLSHSRSPRVKNQSKGLAIALPKASTTPTAPTRIQSLN